MAMRDVFERAYEQGEAWRVEAVTRAHRQQTAYAARYEREGSAGTEVYTSATTARDGRRLVWHDLASGYLYCASCGEEPCEHSGSVRILVELRHDLPRTWSGRAA